MGAGGPTTEVIARALIHVARQLGEPLNLGEQVFARRSRWTLCWALAAAFPAQSPMRWAATLGLDPNAAAMMLGRVRSMRWFSWRLVVEAIAILNGVAP